MKSFFHVPRNLVLVDEHYYFDFFAKSISTAFFADSIDVSMLETAASMALRYISRLSIRVGGSLLNGLNIG